MAINFHGEISVFEFMSSDQIGDVVSNRANCNITQPCQQALDRGATTVVFPQGTYLTNGFSINKDSITVVGKGNVRILLSQAGDAAFSIESQRHFVGIENLQVESLQVNDKRSYGIIFQGSNAHATIKNICCKNFKGGSGIEYRQTVNSDLNNIRIHSCLFGILFQEYNGIPCTTASVRRAYITGLDYA